MKLYLHKGVLYSFLFATIVLLGLGIFSFLSIQRLIETNRMLSHATRVVAKSEEVLKAMVDVETSVRGYVITTDSAYLVPYLEALQTLPAKRLELDSLIGTDASHVDQQEEFDQLNSLINRRLTLAGTRVIAANQRFESARALITQGDGKRIMDSIRLVVKNIQNKEQTFLRAHSGISGGYLRQFQLSLLGLVVIVMVIVAILFFFINKQMKARKRAEIEARKTSTEIKDLYDNAPCGYLSVGSDIFLVNVNKTLLNWMGYSFREVVGKMKYEDLLSPLSKEKFLAGFEKDFALYQKQGYVNDLEFEFKRKDGSVFPVIVNSIAVFDDAGNFLKSRSTVFDNTERKKAEKEITHLANIIESTREAVYSVTKDFRIRSWNKGAEKLYGFTAAEAIGKPVFEIVQSRMDEDNRLNIRNHIIKHGYWEGELEHMRKDGSLIYILASATVILNGPSEYDGYVSVAQDITERKKAEHLLKKFKEELEEQVEERTREVVKVHTEKEAVLSRISDSVVSVNKDWRYTYLNDAALPSHPGGREGTLGKVMWEVHPQMEGTIFQKKYFQALQTGLVQEIEGYYEPMDVWFYVKIYPGPDGLTIFYRDITERKKVEIDLRASEARLAELNASLEQKVQERTEQLARVNEELEAFSYSVSHDLRSPLRSIDGYASILEEDYAPLLDSEGKRVIATITRNALRMGRLIDDMLSLSKLGRIEAALAQLNMHDVVAKIVNELLEFEKNHTVKIQVLNMLPARADLDMIRQVWINLISNAIKYSSKKTSPEVEIGSYHQDDMVCYYVRDNGAGFNQQYAHKLFGVFQRLHKQHEFDGTGVGLAICKRIIERHHGRIWAEGQADIGATFFFALPKM